MWCLPGWWPYPFSRWWTKSDGSFRPFGVLHDPYDPMDVILYPKLRRSRERLPYRTVAQTTFWKVPPLCLTLHPKRHGYILFRFLIPGSLYQLLGSSIRDIDNFMIVQSILFPHSAQFRFLFKEPFNLKSSMMEINILGNR